MVENWFDLLGCGSGNVLQTNDPDPEDEQRNPPFPGEESTNFEDRSADRPRTARSHPVPLGTHVMGSPWLKTTKTISDKCFF